MSIDRLCTSFAHLEVLNPRPDPPAPSPVLHHDHHHHVLSSPTSSSSSSSIPPVCISPIKPRGQMFHSFLCLDVESTCINSHQVYLFNNPHNLTDSQMAWMYPNEIIEWPVILMQWRHFHGRWELYEAARYRSFVKPCWRPKVSEFCTQLTGITQENIDDAPTLAQMLRDFQVNFVERYQLFTSHNRSVWVTDGPWDLRDHWIKSIFLSKLKRNQIPPYLQSPINMIDMRYLLQAFIPKVFCMMVPSSLSLNDSLKTFGLEFVGQEHSGIDDAANLSRLMNKMTQFDCFSNGIPYQWVFRVNRTLNLEPKRYFWMGKNRQCTWTGP